MGASNDVQWLAQPINSDPRALVPAIADEYPEDVSPGLAGMPICLQHYNKP